MTNKIDCLLYLVTDRALMSACSLELAVEQALEGGCTVIQLREKDALTGDYVALADKVKKVTDRYNVPLIINDRVDIALAVDAAGVHLGQKDMPCAAARKILGKNKIIGVSANNVVEAMQAECDGADYLGVGAVFSTSTKTNTRPLTRETLMEIKAAVSIPIVAIGGIKEDKLPFFLSTGIDGVAVASAIISQANIAEAARNFKDKLKTIITKSGGKRC